MTLCVFIVTFLQCYQSLLFRLLKLAFPFCKNKIQNTTYAINKDDFDFSTKKVNMITYMPRKLADHVEHLI